MTMPEKKDSAEPKNIRMSDQLTNIIEAMCAIQSELKPIPKTGYNEFHQYDYAKFESFVDHVREVLSKHDMFLVTTIHEPRRLEPRVSDKSKTQNVVEVKVTLRIMHKSGEWMEIDCYGEGQDVGDKAIYKAITGARKYALASLLGLSTADDPEKDERKPASEQYKKPNNASNGGTRKAPPPYNKKTGETKPPPPPLKTATPEEGGITLGEIMNRMSQAKTPEEIVNCLDMSRGIGMTPEQKERLTKLKDTMKAKIQA